MNLEERILLWGELHTGESEERELLNDAMAEIERLTLERDECRRPLREACDKRYVTRR